ncbi:hypothetical protein [Roseovarius indicus]|uniref:Uncharacterized protein n=1 Tax=Roseovarius indicus TaxID=540747 RepID=A0A5P3A7H3_9RHOB|nr:hypothetical protein [Roseovarius indicus]QEW24520.1 hypothetical protein RIdsm_00300 [Roseovarius indicus]SFE24868.1 hypothetical protein SAMN04488031_10792 [Roseovarius indicus]
MGEVQLAALLCAFLAGSDDEVRHYFDVYDTKRYVRVDCETPDHVIEVGMDGTSSARDSVHQALFYAHLTGKTPVVLMIDQDGFEGRFEYEMRHVTEMANVGYARCSKGAILRWVESSPMRASVTEDGEHDLPATGNVGAACDLGAVFGRDALESF